MTDEGAQSLAVVLLPTAALAVVTVDGVPLVGTWAFVNGSQVEVSVSTEGIAWLFQMSATACASGKVTAAEGSARDPFQVGHPCSWSRLT